LVTNDFLHFNRGPTPDRQVIRAAAAALLSALVLTGCGPLDLAGCGRLSPTRCNRHANTSNLAGTLAAAQAGDVVCLAPGNYGTFRGGSKSGYVSLVPEPGALVSMSLNLNPADHLRLDGVVITGGYIGNSHDLAITHDRFTGPLRLDTQRAGENIWLDADTFDNVDLDPQGYEGRLSIRGYDNTAPVGVTVTNSHFGNGGQSDGVQIIGGAYGAQVGPGNEFSGIRQGNYTAHVDPIQLYGSSHTLITGNYFHDNSTGVIAGDGGVSEQVIGNVFVMNGGYPWAVVAGSWTDGRLQHNTVVDGAGFIVNGGNPRRAGARNWVLDNVLPGLTWDPGNLQVEDWNLLPNGVGSGGHDLHGRPSFLGGSSLISYGAFHLVPGSLGSRSASDGQNIGIP
jgi:hypothetical protein